MLFLAAGGPVLGFFYKAVNTMDSMIGYHNEKYLYFGKVADIPIFVLIAAAVLSQLAALLLVGAVVLFWSWNRKSYLQASFLSFLMLALPLVLAVLGLDFAKWISIYGIYGWTGFL